MKKIFPLALLCAAAYADASPLFDNNAVIDVELTGPIGTLIKIKDDRTESPFVLSANGVEHSVQVRVRGKSRLRVARHVAERTWHDQNTQGGYSGGGE